MLEFGTTVLAAEDGSMAGLLGASPGASTAVPAMLDIMERCFADRYRTWLPKLKEIVPSLGVPLSTNPKLFEEVWAHGTRVLKLDRPAEGLPVAGPDTEHHEPGGSPTRAVTA